MRTRLGIALVGIALAALSLGVAGASAATEIGDECSGKEAEGPYSLIPEARASGGTLPLAAPAGGVVTSWKVNSSRSEPVPERMAVFRPTGAAGTFQVVGESNEEVVSLGANAFATRIPIQAGDRVGPVAVTIDSPLFCITGDNGDQAWAFVGSVGLGSTHTFFAGIQVRVPLVATIEPDADGDGYGDETQDKCPQSAATQGACPRVTLDAFPIVLKRSILVLVSASSEAAGHTSSVRSAVGNSRRRDSKTQPADSTRPRLIVGLRGGTQTVRPARSSPSTSSCRRRSSAGSGRIPPSESLKAHAHGAARQTSQAGRVSTSTVKLRLKGQQPKRVARRPSEPGPAPPRCYPPRVGSPPARHVLPTARKARA